MPLLSYTPTFIVALESDIHYIAFKYLILINQLNLITMIENMPETKIAAHLYLLYFQVGESFQLSEDEIDSLEVVIDQALEQVGFPLGCEVIYDHEGGPRVKWPEGFDYREYLGIDQQDTPGAKLYNHVTELAVLITPEELVDYISENLIEYE